MGGEVWQNGAAEGGTPEGRWGNILPKKSSKFQVFKNLISAIPT